MSKKEHRGIAAVYEDGKKYIQNRLEYAELKALNRTTRVLSNLLTKLAIFILFLMAFFFGSITLGFYLSMLLASNALGFGIVALLYLVLAVIINLTKNKYIEGVIVNQIIKKYYEGDEKDN